MEALKLETIQQVILFAIPGFISMKVYGLIIPGERADSSKQILDCVAYSSINYGIVAVIYLLINTLVSVCGNSLPPPFSPWVLVPSVFITPAIWPLLWLKVLKIKVVRTRTISPHETAWDLFFSSKQTAYVLVTMKDGTIIGGWYGPNSGTSTYPNPNQIYLEEAWKMDGRKFIKPKTQTGGIILSATDFVSIELFISKENNAETG
jgi:hypothetical protein